MPKTNLLAQHQANTEPLAVVVMLPKLLYSSFAKLCKDKGLDKSAGFTKAFAELIKDAVGVKRQEPKLDPDQFYNHNFKAAVPASLAMGSKPKQLMQVHGQIAHKRIKGLVDVNEQFFVSSPITHVAVEGNENVDFISVSGFGVTVHIPALIVQQLEQLGNYFQLSKEDVQQQAVERFIGRHREAPKSVNGMRQSELDKRYSRHYTTPDTGDK